MTLIRRRPAAQSPRRGLRTRRRLWPTRLSSRSLAPGIRRRVERDPDHQRCGLAPVQPRQHEPRADKAAIWSSRPPCRSATTDQLHRTAPADDIQGPAAASFLFNDLGVRRLLVIDDTGFGRRYPIPSARPCEARRDGDPALAQSRADPSTVMGPLSRAKHPATAVFFGGFADTGAPALAKAMVASGSPSCHSSAGTASVAPDPRPAPSCSSPVMQR